MITCIECIRTRIVYHKVSVEVGAMRRLYQLGRGVHTIRQRNRPVVVELRSLVYYTDASIERINVYPVNDNQVRVCASVASSLAEPTSTAGCCKFSDGCCNTFLKQVERITPHTIGFRHFGFANSVVVAGDLEHTSRFALRFAESGASVDATHNHREGLLGNILRFNEHIDCIRKANLPNVATLDTATNVRYEFSCHTSTRR